MTREIIRMTCPCTTPLFRTVSVKNHEARTPRPRRDARPTWSSSRIAKSEDFSRKVSDSALCRGCTLRTVRPSRSGFIVAETLVIAQATMKPDFRKLVVLELELQSSCRAASRAHAGESSAGRVSSWCSRQRPLERR